MNKIVKIISEELHRFLKEYDDDYDDTNYSLFEQKDELKMNLLNDFLFNNNENFTKRMKWVVVPALRLKKIWEDYIRVGVVRDEKGISLIESIMIRNTLNLHTLTYLSGRSSANPDEDFEESWGEYVKDYINRISPEKHSDATQMEIPFKFNENVEINHYYDNIRNIPFQEYINEHGEDLNREKMKSDLMEILLGYFYDYYTIDKNGTAIMSDYGTEPLVKLAFELAREKSAENKVVIIDKMLNVVHQRSDLASWFIEGGSSSLSNISGYDIPDGNYNYKSAVSGA